MEAAIALSGGGVRGAAHLGIIKALEEHGIKIKRISGTSAGAIVGVFYAAGFPPDEILEIIIKTKLLKMLKPALNRGLLKIDVLGEILEEYLPFKTFEKLQLPLTVSATRLKDAKTVYFSTGDFVGPVKAASAIPVLFKPVEIDGEAYIDGGVVNNLPVEPVENKGLKVIGALCNPIDEDFRGGSLRSMIERTLLISINTNTYPRRDRCDVIIEPSGLKRVGVFNISRAREIFEIGYRYTLDRIEDIQENLQKK